MFTLLYFSQCPLRFVAISGFQTKVVIENKKSFRVERKKMHRWISSTKLKLRLKVIIKRVEKEIEIENTDEAVLAIWWWRTSRFADKHRFK